MPRLSELLGDRSEVTLSFPGADVHVVYRPSAYTREFEAELSTMDTTMPTDDVRDKCDDYLSRLIVEWDLTDDNDDVIEPTHGNIKEKVPAVFLITFISKLLEAIAGEAAAGRKKTSTTIGTTTKMATPTPLPRNRVEERAAARKR